MASGTVEVKASGDAPQLATASGSLLDEILPKISLQGPNVVSQTSTTESSTAEDGAVTTTHKVVRESVQTESDDARDQSVKTSQTVEKEVTQHEGDDSKRTVEITRERVVVQRKVKTLLVSLGFSLRSSRGD